MGVVPTIAEVKAYCLDGKYNSSPRLYSPLNLDCWGTGPVSWWLICLQCNWMRRSWCTSQKRGLSPYSSSVAGTEPGGQGTFRCWGSGCEPQSHSWATRLYTVLYFNISKIYIWGVVEMHPSLGELAALSDFNIIVHLTVNSVNKIWQLRCSDL